MSDGSDGRIARAPASAARRRGAGFSHLDPEGGRFATRTRSRRDPEPRDSAGLARGVDLQRPRRPHPGDRPRRSRAQAVPLPRALAPAGGAAQVRVHARIRREPSPLAAGGEEGPRPRGNARERALACAVRLLDLGFFRIGGEEYAETNESYGVATVLREHVSIEGEEVVFDFPAKGGQRRVQSIRDPEVRRRSRRCGEDAAGPDDSWSFARALLARRPLRGDQRVPAGEDGRGVRPRTSAPGTEPCSPRSSWPARTLRSRRGGRSRRSGPR